MKERKNNVKMSFTLYITAHIYKKKYIYIQNKYISNDPRVIVQVLCLPFCAKTWTISLNQSINFSLCLG